MRNRLMVLRRNSRRTQEQTEEYHDIRNRLSVFLWETFYANMENRENIIRNTDDAGVNVLEAVEMGNGFNLIVLNEEVFFRMDSTCLSNITEEYGSVREVFERTEMRYTISG